MEHMTGKIFEIKRFAVHDGDGSEWDEGYFAEHKNYIAGAYYSNNLNLEDENGKFLLVQYSSPYTKEKDPYYIATVNVKHMRVEVERK